MRLAKAKHVPLEERFSVILSLSESFMTTLNCIDGEKKMGLHMQPYIRQCFTAETHNLFIMKCLEQFNIKMKS